MEASATRPGSALHAQQPMGTDNTKESDDQAFRHTEQYRDTVATHRIASKQLLCTLCQLLFAVVCCLPSILPNVDVHQ